MPRCRALDPAAEHGSDPRDTCNDHRPANHVATNHVAADHVAADHVAADHVATGRAVSLYRVWQKRGVPQRERSM